MPERRLPRWFLRALCATGVRRPKLSGAEFDRKYMEHMVSDHRKAVAEFKKASESAQDPETKAFAAKTLPKLQDHLTQAQSINDSVKSASR
jgi:putative membrane protein